MPRIVAATNTIRATWRHFVAIRRKLRRKVWKGPRRQETATRKVSDPAAVPIGLKEKVYLKMVEKGSATAGLQALEDEPAPSPAVLENEFWGGIADDLPPPSNLPPPSRVRPLPLGNGDDDFDGGMADARAGGSGGNQGRLAGDDNESGEVIGAVTHVEGMPVYEEAATNGAEGATRYKVL